MVSAKSVGLISQGQGLGCERREGECVHVGDNRPFSTPLSVPLAHSWDTAGLPTKLSQPLICLLRTSFSSATQHTPTYRMPDMQGKGIRGKRVKTAKKKKKTSALMGRRKEEVMMGPTAPKIHLGLGGRGSVSDRQVFLSSHTNPGPAPPL